MDRETFVKLFNKYNLDELLIDNFNYEKFNETENFIIYYDYEMETIHIIDRNSLESSCIRAVSWYKLNHVGRSLQFSGIRSTSKRIIDMFLKQLSEDLKEKQNEQISEKESSS